MARAKPLHTLHVVPLKGGWTILGIDSQGGPMPKRVAIDQALSLAEASRNVVIHGKKGQPLLGAVAEGKIDERKVRSAVRSIQEKRGRGRSRSNGSLAG